MKQRGLLLLAIVAAAMAAVLVWEGRHRGPGDHAGTHVRLVAPFDRKAVRRIAIRRQQSEGVNLQHAPSPTVPAPAPAWHLERQGEPAADDAAVDDLLAAVDLAESDRTAEVPATEAGLAPPVAQIELETPGGTLMAQLGRADATGQGVYARAGAGGPVRVVGRHLLDLIDRDPIAFRDRRLFPIDAAAVTSVVWQGENGGGALRAVEGRWQNARGEWVASERVAESLRRLHALRIEAFPAAPFVKSNGDRSLVLSAAPARIALDIGRDGDLARGDQHVRVPAAAFDSAWRSLAAAATPDDRLIALAADTVTRIDLHDDHARVALRRVDGAWTFTTPKVAYAADTRAVDDWLTRLGGVKTATRATGPNARHLILEGRFRQEIDVASPPEVAALLAPDPLRFRERAVLSFARFDVRRLERRAGADTQQVISDDGSTWQTPPGATPDTADVARVVGTLGDLHAEEFLPAPPASTPPLRVQVDVQPPGESRPARHALQLWPRKDGACVAHLDADATFTLERATCDELRLDLLSKKRRSPAAALLLGALFGVDALAADGLGRLAFQLDVLRVGRQHRVAFRDHLACGVLELLVDDEAVRGGEPADRVDREHAGHHVLFAGLGDQRLRLARVPVLDRVVRHQQAVIQLGSGRVAHEEVGLVAGTAAARHLRRLATLGGRRGGLLALLERRELLLLFLLRLRGQIVVALPLLGGALVDLQQVSLHLDVLVQVLAHVLAQPVDRQLAGRIFFRRGRDVEVRRRRKIHLDRGHLLSLPVGEPDAAGGQQRHGEGEREVVYGRHSLHEDPLPPRDAARPE